MRINIFLVNIVIVPVIPVSYTHLISRASLYNKLKALTDMGANDYITQIRMERAIWLIPVSYTHLLSVTLPVTFICWANISGIAAIQKTHTRKTLKRFFFIELNLN